MCSPTVGPTQNLTHPNASTHCALPDGSPLRPLLPVLSPPGGWKFGRDTCQPPSQRTQLVSLKSARGSEYEKNFTSPNFPTLPKSLMGPPGGLGNSQRGLRVTWSSRAPWGRPIDPAASRVPVVLYQVTSGSALSRDFMMSYRRGPHHGSNTRGEGVHCSWQTGWVRRDNS